MKSMSYFLVALKRTINADNCQHIRSFSLMARRPLFGILTAVLLSIFALSSPCLYAQVQNGTIEGTVTDTTGAIVPDASVTVRQLSTNLVLHAQTNEVGLYSVPQLLPNEYSVSVEKQGFKKSVTHLTLTVGQVAHVDFALEVGSKAETINVEANSSAALDTETSNLDYTVQSKQMDSLPLNGRNPYGLAVLSPGIAAGSNFGVGVAVARGAVVAAATNNFESNGGIGGNNDILLDGVSIVVCCQGQPAVTPSAEVVSQFKVASSTPPAQYGRSSGAVLNIATKSGGNRVHGDIYDFIRNDKLDAANYFTKRNGVYPYKGHNDFRPPHRANQFGGFVSGPVVLPRLYNGIDKTFFTFGYEGVRNTAPITGTVTVPTKLMRQGIFTEAPAVVYNPTSYDPMTRTRTPIPAATCNDTVYSAGRCIPETQFDPTAKALMALIPEPNLDGITNNYSYAENITDQDDQFSFRIDQNFSDRHRTFVRGTRGANNHVNYDLFNRPNGPNQGWTQTLTSYLFAAGHLWAFSPNTLLQFTYGFARQKNLQLPSQFLHNATDYGFSSNFASEQQVSGIPTLSFTGLQSMGYGNFYNLWGHNQHALNVSALLQSGKHSLAIGYNGMLVLENQEGVPSGSIGGLTFNTQFTGGPSPTSALPGGQGAFDAWASFLLGYPGSANMTRSVTVAFNQWVNGLYVQDDWHLTPKLTVNAGLRWDVETGFGERHNHWATFDPNILNPISSVAGVTVRGGALFMGANGNPTRTSPTFFHQVSPRLGASWSINDKTVARGGYGILFLPISQRGYSASNIGYSQGTNMPTSADGFTPVATIANPFPDGVLPPAGASAGTGVSAGTSLSGLQYDNPVSYQQQWNLGIERVLTRALTFSLNYVGGHGVHLPLAARPNDLQPAYFGAVGDKNQVSYLQQQVSNPFYAASSSLAPGSLLRNPTVQRAQLIANFPQYTNGAIGGIQNYSVYINYLDQGSTTYNALQASLLIHGQNGLTGSVSYVFSKALGNVSDLTNGFLNATGNPGIQNYYLLHDQEHSLLATDTPHRFTGTVSWPIPVGRGQKFGSNMPSWANAIVGGWSANTIVLISSGYPISFQVTGVPAFAGTRPMWVDGVSPLTSGSTKHRLGGAGQTQGYLNPAAFALPVEFQLGNVPRSAGRTRGPLSFDNNVSVIKNITIHEDLSLDLRGEAFNILNKAAFALPSATLGSSNFGRITSQSNSPRNIQVSAKLRF
jgi:Carboxypeptidase regulatory-like domain